MVDAPSLLFALFAERNAATTDLAKRYQGLIDPQIREPFHEGGIWLVRPDVACAAEDAGVVAGYLDGIVAG
jgi:hypothetical protein